MLYLVESKICPIHPKTGKWVKLDNGLWKLRCKKCYEMVLGIHEYKDCPDPYKCNIHIGIGGTP